MFHVEENSQLHVQSESASEYGEVLSVLEQIRKKKRSYRKKQVIYVNADFILGSVAKDERLWSLSHRSLSQYRKSCAPVLSEALLFLKVNSEYWDFPLVSEAKFKAKSDKVVDRLASDDQEEELVGYILKLPGECLLLRI